MNIHVRLANYITRYAPSYKRVIGYLERKNIENITTLLSEIGYDEGIMCDIWIRSLLVSTKGEYEILQKLRKKDFPKEMIQKKISLVHEEIHDWELHSSMIRSSMDTYIQRGKSLRFIESSLISRFPYFHTQIQEMIHSMDDTNGLKKEVQKYRYKYNISIPSQKQKLYAALMRKGFGYKQIQAELDENIEEV